MDPTEQYMNLPAGGKYQRAMAAFVAAAQNYNDLVLKINYLWTTLWQSQKDRAAISQQIAAVKVGLAFSCIAKIGGAL